MASFYAVYHGPQGLKTIAERIHRFADILATGLTQKGAEKGVALKHSTYFDTLTVMVNNNEDVLASAYAKGMNLRADLEGAVGVSLDETTTREDIIALFDVLLDEEHGLTVEG